MSASSALLPLDPRGRRRLKVAFVGTYGLGKTTLCFDRAAQLKRLDLGADIVKDAAPRCPLPIERRDDRPRAGVDPSHAIAEAIEASADYEVVICDRFEGKRAVSPGFQHEIDGIIDDLIVAFGVTFQPP